ncbi:MAG: ATP-dependent DNA helicase RecG, partial [Bacteroidia bacterium]|nr:ATP-dependent DNA helicase RecG [Bacteroidia bacterium]
AGKQMNRLLQGDVGSGKTVIALMSMLMGLDNGFQACMMAPTEILATQHYLSLVEMLEDMPVTIKLLTGSSKKKEREEISEMLINGTLNILVGTHALIEDNVIFNNLGMVVIDEQHRFGVAQRAKLWFKVRPLPHVLVMTATPIPRTLAMSVHGELDVSVIDELPAGRKPIRTVHKDESYRGEAMEFIRTQIAAGRQAYFVYPLIEESAALDLQDLMQGYETVTDFFPLPKYQVSMVHGRMKPAEKESEMQRFKKGITNIMVATTVIEVGVNVPNASVMLIESSERFGLSQLHQLRGRVGRGADQSYCILMTKGNINFIAKQRIKAMTSTTDGFVISKTDLQLRGPGDVLGTRQSGLPDFKLLDLVADEDIIAEAKNAAHYILEKDPDLKHPENEALMNYLMRHQSDNFWGRVS